MKRRPLSKRSASKVFRRGAKVHKKNMRRAPQRGGIRL